MQNRLFACLASALLLITSDIGYAAESCDGLPIASFELSRDRLDAPVKITADATSSTDCDGVIVASRWSFGDGTNAESIIAHHNYTEPGDYTIQLEVEDDTGNLAQSSQVLSVLADFCPIFPIALDANLLAGVDATDTTNFIVASTGSGPGNFSQISWTGKPGPALFALSLTPPGDSFNYVNPDDADDHLPEPGDWIYGTPGIGNAQAVREAMDELLGLDIIVPVYSTTREQGAQFQYQIESFATILLSEYDLARKQIVFSFRGEAVCYSQPPTVEDVVVQTDEGTAVRITLVAVDPDVDETVGFSVASQPVNGALGALSIKDSRAAEIVYIPNEGFVGRDSFSVVASDGSNLSPPATISITVNEIPKQVEIVSFGTDSTTISIGESATLFWNVATADEVQIQPRIGAVDSSGTLKISPTSSTTYTLTATNGSGNELAEQFIEVLAVPTAALMVSSPSISLGEMVDLSWQTSGADSITIEPGFGSVGANGSLTIPPNETNTYTLTASNTRTTGLSAVSSASVTVLRPIEVAFSADPNQIDPGQPAFLSWSTLGADSVSIEPEIGHVASAGIVEVAPTKPTRYTLTATNGADTVVQSVEILVDPGLTILEPSDFTVTSAPEVTVSGLITDGLGFEVFVQQVPADVSAGQFSNSVALREGRNNIRVTAKDMLGNEFSSTREVTRDTTAPIITVDYPFDGLTISQTPINVSGHINDIVRGTLGEGEAFVFVNGIEAQLDNRNYVADGIALVPGPNTISVTGTDAAGNSAARSIDVTYTPPSGDRIDIAMGDRQSGMIDEPLSQPLQVKVSDGAGGPLAGKPVAFRVVQGSGTVSTLDGADSRALIVETDAQGIAAVNFRLGLRSGVGNHKVRAQTVGVGELVFHASAAPAPAEKFGIIGGHNQIGVVGQPLATALTVAATDSGGNLIPGTLVEFQVVRGSGVFENNSRSYSVETDNDGRAAASWTLGEEEGYDQQMVEVRLPGTAASAFFTASAFTPGNPANTRISGLVVDNQDNPMPGVAIRLGGTQLSAITDSQGQFGIDAAPVGTVHLIADGKTTTRSGLWPTLAFEIHTVSGIDNRMPIPIYLVKLDESQGQVSGGNTAASVTLEEIPGFQLDVAPNSVTFPDGTSEGIVSVTPVNANKVPMPPPNGRQPRLVVTIQPGGAHFDPPAALTVPNVDGLAPGRQIEMISFDHDLEEFVVIGLGSVSDNGLLVESNSGVGVVKAGWHFAADPESTGEAQGEVADCKKNEEDGGDETGDGTGDGTNDGTEEPIPPECLDPGTDPKQEPKPNDNQNNNQTENEKQNTDSTADPVLVGTGELKYTQVDLAIPGRGFDFTFARTYRSKYQYNGPLGHGWNHNHNERLVFLAGVAGDINRTTGDGRVDTYRRNDDGTYTTPDGFYNVLRRNLDGSFWLRDRYGFVTEFNAQGFMTERRDRNNNRMVYRYDDRGRLSVIEDTLGREIIFGYFPNNRIQSITDFSGRQCLFNYDLNGDLRSARSPIITGTSTGNDFLNGKTTRYTYSNGFANSFLNHNLLTVTDPKGQQYLENTYGQIEGSYSFDRVLRQREGEADQVHVFEYRELNAGSQSDDPNLPRNQTTVTDRNGNVTVKTHNAGGNLLESRVETNRGINPADPPSFITRHRYNKDGQRIETIFPEGNRHESIFDDQNEDSLQRGNLLEIILHAGPRGASQSQLRLSMRYEPIYNQIRSVTDPRGHQIGFQPPNGGLNSTLRYTTDYFFDYQEFSSLDKLSEITGLGVTDVSGLLVAAGVEINIGNINGDGNSGQASGNVVRRAQPTVQLLDGGLQQILTDYHYNDFGQTLRVVDAEGNVDVFAYYPENDPDGDGRQTVSRRELADNGGGYQRAQIQDAQSSSRRDPSQPIAAIRTEKGYDEVGNVVRSIDGRGNMTRLERNALNQVVRITLEAPFNYLQEIHYDANNNIVRREIQNVDANGPDLDESVTLTFGYDILNYPVRETKEVSTTEILEVVSEYDANRNLRRQVQPEGNSVEWIHDERDQIFSTTRGAGSADASTSIITYDGNGNPIRYRDAEDNTGNGEAEITNLAYDGHDRLIDRIDALGNITHYAYDPVNNNILKQYFGPQGGPSPNSNEGLNNVLLAEMRYEHDELQRLYEHNELIFSLNGQSVHEGPLTPGDGLITTRYEFDRLSRRTRSIDDNEHSVQYQYDGVDRLIMQIDELDNEITYTYDDNHNVIALTELERSPENLVEQQLFATRFEYDSLDRLIKVKDNLANIKSFTYDSRNNKVFEVDPLGNTTSYFYDGINRQLRQQVDLRVGGTGAGDIEGNDSNLDGRIETVYAWDGNSRLAAISDDKGNTTGYQYDDLNRPRFENFADGTVKEYRYDRDDNLRELEDQNGSLHLYTVDGLGRRTETRITRATGVVGTDVLSHQYDGLSRRTFVFDNNNPEDDADDWTIEMAYDSLHRMISEVQNGAGVARTFDGVGNKLSMVYPNGRQINRNFDGLDRVKQIVEQADEKVVAEYDYLGPNRTLERRYANGVRLSLHNGEGQTTGYDGLKRVTGMAHADNLGSAISGFDYGYDQAGNRRFEYDRFRDAAKAFELDSAYRVTRSKTDVGGSQISSLVNNQIVNSDIDQLSGTAEEDYVLDGIGNWINKTEAGEPTAYLVNEMNEYDQIGEAVQVHDENGNLTTDSNLQYQYDALNRLVRVADVNDVETARYSYDGLGRRTTKLVNGQQTQFLYDGDQVIEERDGANATLRQFLFGRGVDEVLQMRSGQGDFYYSETVQNSVAALTDEFGAPVERYVYGDYGELTILDASGSLPLIESAIGNPFTYTGRRFDNETGLYYYRARFYDPDRGRFLTRDPLGYADGMGVYGYVNNNPLQWIDPFGLEGISDALRDQVDRRIKDYLDSLIDGEALPFDQDPYWPLRELMKDLARNTAAEFAGPVLDSIDSLRRGEYSQASLNLILAVCKQCSGLNRLFKGLKKVGPAAKELKNKVKNAAKRAANKAKDALSSGWARLKKRFSNKKPPNPDGRLGKPSTRKHIDDVATEMEARGYTIVGGGNRLPEEFLPGPGGGRRGSSYPDITGTKDGRTLRVNTVDTRVDGITPSTREATNAARIRSQTTGDHLLLIPKPS